MLVNNQVASHPEAGHPELLGPLGTQPDLRLLSAFRDAQSAETQDVASIRAAVDAWAVECGLAVQDFQRNYLQERVDDLLDQYPTLGRQDAEHLALATEIWLEDRAA